MTGRFGSRSLFDEHRRECKEGFRNLARELQNQLTDMVEEQVELVRADLQMLKDENVVLESERDPGFRKRVGVEMERVTAEVERLAKVVGEE
jgi:hypothetical protein